MSLLTDLYELNEAAEDMSLLPEDIMSELQKNIRDGAKDLDQDWANALHLVHKAYEIAEVQRPNPSMKSAWRQYEENIQYAVSQLSKHRPHMDDWKMSSSMFREAMERKVTFRVAAMGDKFGEAYTVNAKSLDDVLDSIKSKNTDMYDIDVQKADDNNSATLTFSKWGIKKNYRLKVERNINP